MRHIPTYCEDCGASALLSAAVITEGVALCSSCSGPARVLPGESYAEQDVNLFAELINALHEAGVSPTQASYLVQELEIRKFGRPGRALRRIVQIVPGLGMLELIVGNHPASTHKAEGMLALLLEAIASGRSHPGTAPPVSGRHGMLKGA